MIAARSAAERSLAPNRTPPARPVYIEPVLAILNYKDVTLEVKITPKSTHLGLCTAIKSKLGLELEERLVLVDTADNCDVAIDHTLGAGTYTVLVMPEADDSPPVVRIFLPVENVLMKRCRILVEMLTSERTHVSKLKRIDTEFRIPLSDEKRPPKMVIPEETRSTLFPKQLEILIPISEQIEAALEAAVGPIEKALQAGETPSPEDSQTAARTVGTLFVDNCTFLKQNGNYFNLYTKALEVYMDLTNREKHGPEGRYGFLLHEATCSALLRDFLILPIQRTLKYPLLLRELQATLQPEDAAFEEVSRGLTAVQEVASFCNEEKRRYEEREKVSRVVRQFGLAEVLGKSQVNELLFDGSAKEVRLKRVHLYGKLPPEPTLVWVFDTKAVFGNFKNGEFSLLADPSYHDDALEVLACPPDSASYQRVFPEKALVRRKSTTFGRMQAIIKGLKPWPQDYHNALAELARANAYVNSRGLRKIDRHSVGEGLILVLAHPVPSPEQALEDAAVAKTRMSLAQLASANDHALICEEAKLSATERQLVKNAIRRQQTGKKPPPNLAAMDVYASKMHFLAVSEDGAPPPPPTGEEWTVAQWVFTEDRHLLLYRGNLADVSEDFGADKHLLVDMDLNGKTKFQAEDVSRYVELPNTLSISNAPRESNSMWTYLLSSGDHRQLREEILVAVRPMSERGEYDVEYVKAGDKARVHYVLEAKYTRDAKTTSLFFEAETEQLLQTWLSVFDKALKR